MATTASISIGTTRRPEMKYKEIIRNLLHVPHDYYKWIAKLQRAAECKGKIPKAYIYDEDYWNYDSTYADCFNIGLTKQEAKMARQQLIDEIVYTILNEEKTDRGSEMMPDNYARLFHALAILKLPKDTNLFTGTTTNRVFNTIYTLWRLDDGSKQAGDVIIGAAWYMADELKKRSGEHYTEDECLILGLKC